MATATLISLEQYLATSYRPDREYIDGEVVERNMGKWAHSRLQALLTGWFFQHEEDWHIQVATEWRTQVSSTRVRIPDLILVGREPQPDVLAAPPLLLIEILSPDDTYSEIQKRADDYQRMGVQTIWIIDPTTRTARVCTGPNWIEATRLEVAGTPIHVDLIALFRDLDETAA
jgi:Uma2 family endonuclease